MKKNTFIIVMMLLTAVCAANAQRRVVLITLDGYRWNELFGGADSIVFFDKDSGVKEETKQQYWRESREERRKALMPFTWSFVKDNGVIIGNRWKGCTMQITNTMRFSYPGYSELLCGYADDERMNTNANIPNPNVSVLEVINNTPQYNGKVAVVASWERFAEILNEERSQLPVNCGYDHAMSPTPTQTELITDKLQDASPQMWPTERFDTFTHSYALETMKNQHPSVLYVAYGDTDLWGDTSRYRLYLEAANYIDGFIKELWEYAQSDPFYKDKTTFIVTCDHGRGEGSLKQFRNHYKNVENSQNTWLMAFGAGIPAKGELTKGNYFNNQVAPTVASLLGVKFAPQHAGAGRRIKF